MERGAVSSLPFRSTSRTDDRLRVDAQGPQGHVLVIEDSDLVSSAMRILFENAGHRVSVAATIAETLEIVTTDAPDLALLDLTLPDGDGLALVEPLHTAGCKTVVGLTGWDDPVTRRRCLDAGCAEVWVKPVPAQELVAKIEAWLS